MLITCLICKTNTELDPYCSCDYCKKGACRFCFDLFRNEMLLFREKNKESCDTCKNDKYSCQTCSMESYQSTKDKMGTNNFELYELNDSILCGKCSEDKEILEYLFLIKWDRLPLYFI